MMNNFASSSSSSLPRINSNDSFSSWKACVTSNVDEGCLRRSDSYGSLDFLNDMGIDTRSTHAVAFDNNDHAAAAAITVERKPSPSLDELWKDGDKNDSSTIFGSGGDWDTDSIPEDFFDTFETNEEPEEVEDTGVPEWASEDVTPTVPEASYHVTKYHATELDRDHEESTVAANEEVTGRRDAEELTEACVKSNKTNSESSGRIDRGDSSPTTTTSTIASATSLGSFSSLEEASHSSGVDGSSWSWNNAQQQKCLDLLDGLQTHQHGWAFNEPVDPVTCQAPHYLDFIKHPMDLGTVEKRLNEGYYHNMDDFAADIRLTFDNAMTYNKHGCKDVYDMAKELKSKFETDYNRLLSELEVEDNKSKRNVSENPHHPRAPVLMRENTMDSNGLSQTVDAQPLVEWECEPKVHSGKTTQPPTMGANISTLATYGSSIVAHRNKELQSHRALLSDDDDTQGDSTVSRTSSGKTTGFDLDASTTAPANLAKEDQSRRTAQGDSNNVEKTQDRTQEIGLNGPKPIELNLETDLRLGGSGEYNRIPTRGFEIVERRLGKYEACKTQAEKRAVGEYIHRELALEGIRPVIMNQDDKKWYEATDEEFDKYIQETAIDEWVKLDGRILDLPSDHPMKTLPENGGQRVTNKKFENKDAAVLKRFFDICEQMNMNPRLDDNHILFDCLAKKTNQPVEARLNLYHYVDKSQTTRLYMEAVSKDMLDGNALRKILKFAADAKNAKTAEIELNGRKQTEVNLMTDFCAGRHHKLNNFSTNQKVRAIIDGYADRYTGTTAEKKDIRKEIKKNLKVKVCIDGKLEETPVRFMEQVKKVKKGGGLEEWWGYEGDLHGENFDNYVQNRLRDKRNESKRKSSSNYQNRPNKRAKKGN